MPATQLVRMDESQKHVCLGVAERLTAWGGSGFLLDPLEVLQEAKKAPAPCGAVALLLACAYSAALDAGVVREAAFAAPERQRDDLATAVVSLDLFDSTRAWLSQYRVADTTLWGVLLRYWTTTRAVDPMLLKWVEAEGEGGRSKRRRGKRRPSASSVDEEPDAAAGTAAEAELEGLAAHVSPAPTATATEPATATAAVTIAAGASPLASATVSAASAPAAAACADETTTPAAGAHTRSPRLEEVEGGTAPRPDDDSFQQTMRGWSSPRRRVRPRAFSSSSLLGTAGQTRSPQHPAGSVHGARHDDVLSAGGSFSRVKRARRALPELGSSAPRPVSLSALLAAPRSARSTGAEPAEWPPESTSSSGGFVLAPSRV